MIDVGRPTEGLYDTALNEAVEFESRTANDTAAPLEPQTKVCRRPSVKTMLCAPATRRKTKDSRDTLVLAAGDLQLPIRRRRTMGRQYPRSW